jgi:hypothetical protein
MRLGIAYWTRRGWRVQSQSGQLTRFGGSVNDLVTVIFEKARDGEVSGEVPPVESGEGETSTKTCPDCAETVKLAANVCRYCGYRFDGEASAG